MILFFLVFI